MTTRYPRRMRFPLLLLLAAAAPLGGCINTDTAVFVDPSLDTPTLTVANGTLSGFGSASGTFKLTLHLGARASGPSQVQPGEFDIVDATQANTILSALALDAGSTQLPVTVAPDSDVDVSFTFDTGGKTFSADVGKQLCDSAGIVLSGRIQDSLQDTATPVTSEVFHAGGCQ